MDWFDPNDLGPPSYLGPEEAEYEHLRMLACEAQNERTRNYYNCQARDYIFCVNNTSCAEDEIDLHGLYVMEATDILRKRIEVDIEMGRSGIHVIVGRGNRSEGKVQKIRPAVEKLCHDLNLRVLPERNPGRVYISLAVAKPIGPLEGLFWILKGGPLFLILKGLFWVLKGGPLFLILKGLFWILKGGPLFLILESLFWILKGGPLFLILESLFWILKGGPLFLVLGGLFWIWGSLFWVLGGGVLFWILKGLFQIP